MGADGAGAPGALSIERAGRRRTRSAFRPVALSEALFAWLLVVPAVVVILLVIVFPLAYSLWMSFADVNLLRATGPAIDVFGVQLPLFRFVGLQNYARTFADPVYWSSLWRTLYFVAAFVLEATLMGLGMALVLHERFAGRPLMRSLLLIPWSLSRVVVGLLWIGILDFEFGMLNGVLHRAGLIDGYIAFFKDGFRALNVLVSVPALKPILFLVLVLSTVNGFLMLDLIYILTMGGPGQDTTTISWLGFLTAFSFFKFGPGTAILYTLTALCLLLTFVYHWAVMRRFEAEA
jgi:ABC-type sugar transport system permease subunit